MAGQLQIFSNNAQEYRRNQWRVSQVTDHLILFSITGSPRADAWAVILTHNTPQPKRQRGGSSELNRISRSLGHLDESKLSEIEEIKECGTL
jgi:hypothetical protein